jgi:hypothetical protein
MSWSRNTALKCAELKDRKGSMGSCITQEDAVEREGVQIGVHTLTHQHMLCN